MAREWSRVRSRASPARIRYSRQSPTWAMASLFPIKARTDHRRAPFGPPAFKRRNHPLVCFLNPLLERTYLGILREKRTSGECRLRLSLNAPNCGSTCRFTGFHSTHAISDTGQKPALRFFLANRGPHDSK